MYQKLIFFISNNFGYIKANLSVFYWKFENFGSQKVTITD